MVKSLKTPEKVTLYHKNETKETARVSRAEKKTQRRAEENRVSHELRWLYFICPSSKSCLA